MQCFLDQWLPVKKSLRASLVGKIPTMLIIFHSTIDYGLIQELIQLQVPLIVYHNYKHSFYNCTSDVVVDVCIIVGCVIGYFGGVDCHLIRNCSCFTTLQLTTRCIQRALLKFRMLELRNGK